MNGCGGPEPARNEEAGSPVSEETRRSVSVGDSSLGEGRILQDVCDDSKHGAAE